MIDPEEFWAEVLSGEPARVRAAVDPLPPDERDGVVAHLQRMASESGWSPGQHDRATAALTALLRSLPADE